MAKRSKKQRLCDLASRLWTRVVLCRGEHRCAKCEKDWGDIHAHHLIPRNGAHRHTPENGMLLCRDCHQLAEERQPVFRKWLEEEQPRIWAWVERHKRDTGKEIIERYEEAIQELSKELEVSWMD